MRRAWLFALPMAACGSESGLGSPADMGAVDAPVMPDVGVDAIVCPFEDEPDCTMGPCPEGDWVCVEDDATTSTCRLRCEDNAICEACTRVCVPLGGGGGACVVGTGPGEPCDSQPCNPGLDCIGDGAGHAFCRTRCASGMPCVEDHFYCYDRRDGMGNLLGYTCGPYFGALTEGEDCTDLSEYCETGLLCVTQGTGTTCVPMCYPDFMPDGCDMGETCQPVVDLDGDPIGYACL